MERKRKQAIVHGRVQGVAFREYTRREALRLGLSGWVRNLPDGTVEVLFEGSEAQTEALLAWLASGSPSARVTRVEYNELPPQGETGPFFIRHST
jgi:acylphosphatase